MTGLSIVSGLIALCSIFVSCLDDTPRLSSRGKTSSSPAPSTKSSFGRRYAPPSGPRYTPAELGRLRSMHNGWRSR